MAIDSMINNKITDIVIKLFPNRLLFWTLFGLIWSWYSIVQVYKCSLLLEIKCRCSHYFAKLDFTNFSQIENRLVFCKWFVLTLCWYIIVQVDKCSLVLKIMCKCTGTIFQTRFYRRYWTSNSIKGSFTTKKIYFRL